MTPQEARAEAERRAERAVYELIRQSPIGVEDRDAHIRIVARETGLADVMAENARRGDIIKHLALTIISYLPYSYVEDRQLAEDLYKEALARAALKDEDGSDGSQQGL